MKKTFLICCSALSIASYSPRLAAQTASPAEDFTEHLGIFRGSGATDYPALFLSPFPATTPAPSTLYGITFSVSGDDQSMVGTFSSNAEQYVAYEWLQPDGSSLRYNGDGSLQLSAGTYDIWLSPVDGGISINGSSVLTEQSVATAALHFGNISIGAASTAAGTNAFAVGSGVSASAVNSAAFGKGTSAIGADQIVVGRYNVPMANYNVPTDFVFVVGGGTDSSNPSNAMYVRADGSMVLKKRLIIGPQAPSDPETNMGENSLGVGRITEATADSSVAFGVVAFATAPGSIAAGWHTRAGDWDTATINSNGSITPANQIGIAAFGVETWARYEADFACGYYTVADGVAAFAAGDGCHSSSWASTAFGSWTTAKGVASTTLGHQTSAKGYAQTVLGHYNVESGTEGTYAPTDDLLIVGNGVVGTPSNAMTVKHNGDTWASGGLTVEGGTAGAPVKSVFKRDVEVRGVIRVPAAGDIDMGDFKADPTGSFPE